MNGRIFIAGCWRPLEPSVCAELRSCEGLAYWEEQVLSALELWWNDEEDFALKTSGSTGIPRVIRHTKQAMRASAQRTNQAFHWGRGTLAALAMPVEFVGGMMMLVRALEGSWDLLVCEPKHVTRLPDSWNGDGLIDFMALTPSQTIALSMENPSLWLRLKTLLVGGGAVPDWWLQSLHGTSAPQVVESFGMTETVSHFALRERFPREQEAFHCLPGFEVSTEESGRLLVQSPDGILKTNDLAECFSRTQFLWKGRIDDVIVTGGIKVHPAEVERVLQSVIPAEFIVYGAVDAIFGQTVVLRIHAPHPPADALAQEKSILDFAANHLPAHHAPKRVEWLPLEKTWTGKWKRPTN